MDRDSPFSIKSSDIDSLQQAVEEFGETANKTINKVLHDKQTANIVKENIHVLLPTSGRKWRGKLTAASATKPLTEDTSELLTLTVRSKTKYNYLYFPDDGSNTERHQGKQHFMQQGGDNSMNRIVDLCTDRLIESFNKGG